MIKEHRRFIAAIDALQEDARQHQTEVKKRQAAVREALRQLDKDFADKRGQRPTPEERKAIRTARRQRLEVLMEEQRQIGELDREWRSSNTLHQGLLCEATRDEILAAIETKARQEEFDLILDRSARGANKVRGVVMPVILYTNDSMDITDEIIAVLNQSDEETPSEPASEASAGKP